MPTSTKKSLEQAEQKARQRDIQNEKVLTDEEMDQANDLQAKANSRGMKLVPDKIHKNKARFVQIITANKSYLQDHNYLTAEERLFLDDLYRNVSLGSNAIVDDPNKKQPIGLNQTQIATVLGTSKTKVSRVVKSLVDKGILARSESGTEGNNAKSYVLFVNPHIIRNGDKDNIEDTLKMIFSKAMKMPILKSLPERFF